MSLTKLHKKLMKEDEHPLYVKIPLLTFSSWLFQGILYMDTTERYFKIFIDILIFLPFIFIFNYYFNFSLSIFLAILIAHTINWIFNGQIFVVMRIWIENNPGAFTQYLNELKKRISKNDSIIAAAAFGSFSREKLKGSSDLDVRIIRKPGIFNGFKSCFFVMKERSSSLFNKFPLDIYVLDDINMVNKHIKDEKPIIIHDPTKIFNKFN